MIAALLGGGARHTLPARRDARRGRDRAQRVRRGLAVAIEIDETATPLREEVKGFCEILGLDPLYLANEGKVVAVVPPPKADAALAALRAHPLGADAAIIGRVTASEPGSGDDANGFWRRAHRRHARRRAIAAHLLKSSDA